MSKKIPKEITTVYIDKPLKEWAEIYANHLGISFAGLIRLSLHRYLMDEGLEARDVWEEHKYEPLEEISTFS